MPAAEIAKFGGVADQSGNAGENVYRAIPAMSWQGAGTGCVAALDDEKFLAAEKFGALQAAA